jgi:hypothetical protein
MVAKLKMINDDGKVLYEGPVAEECLNYIQRYDDMEVDMDRVASKVYYTYEESDKETDLEMKILTKLDDFEYSSFDSDIKEYKIIWTMK